MPEEKICPWIELKFLFRDFGDLSKRYWLCWVCLFVVGIAVGGGVFCWDEPFLNIFRQKEGHWGFCLAQELSYWGDFWPGTVVVCVGFFTVGLFWRKGKLRQVGMAAILAAAMAGLTADAFKYTLGRPRPSTGLEDGLYGMQMDVDYHSFPSGHTATAMGTVTVISVVYPIVALPALVAGGGVAWSRMALNRHWPSDIWVGLMLGVGFGGIFGLVVRRAK